MPAFAISFSFNDKDFLGGDSWGTLAIDKFDSNTLQVRYEAAQDTTIPAGSQTTGFAFTFSMMPVGISNPADGLYPDDRNELDWIVLTNLGSFPNPENGDEFDPPITKFDFEFGVTEGNDNNFNPPGILPGQYDIFYIDFAPDIFSDIELSSFVSLTGIRLQRLPDGINDGSLTLVGRLLVPEPSTGIFTSLILGCIGLIGKRRLQSRDNRVK